jgi:transposase
MRTPIRVRELTDDEAETVKRWAHSRTEPTRRVERAKLVWLSHAGKLVPAIAEELHLDAKTVRAWLKRFNAQGLAGLKMQPGPDARHVYARGGRRGDCRRLDQPQATGLPFASWTLDRLETYLNEVQGIPIKRTRIDDILLDEGLRWRKQETWFGERVDPEFAEKRGSSAGSTPSHRPA